MCPEYLMQLRFIKQRRPRTLFVGDSVTSMGCCPDSGNVSVLAQAASTVVHWRTLIQKALKIAPSVQTIVIQAQPHQWLKSREFLMAQSLHARTSEGEIQPTGFVR